MLDRVVLGVTFATLSGAAHAAGAAACSAAGAGILKAAHHLNHHAAPQAAAGAVGGAILNGGFALIVGLVAPDYVKGRFQGENKYRASALGETLCAVSTMVVGGMAGAAILRDAGHLDAPSTAHAAAASAVGAAVISGGSLVLGVLLCGGGRAPSRISAV